jgi:hypothetical protein
MPKALTKQDLEKMLRGGCQTPGCNHNHERTLYLHARCHPGAPVEASYTAGSGNLVVGCAICHKLIAVVAVESRPSAYALAE